MTTITEFGGYQITLQAAVNAPTMGYDAPQARYNGLATYDSGADAWVTLDCQLLRVTASHGSGVEEIPGLRGDLGALRADLYDPDRFLDPAGSPFALLTRPGCAVRLLAVSPEHVEIPLWTGNTSSWNHDLLTGEGQLQAIDRISHYSGTVLEEWLRPAENSNARYAAINAAIASPLPTVLEGAGVALDTAKMSGDLWSSSVRTTSEAELSIVWVDQTGVLRRRDPSIGVVTAVTATDCDDGISGLIYTELSSEVTDDLLVNVVQAERVGIANDGRPLPFRSNSTSIGEFGPYTFTKLNLPVQTDQQMYAWMDKILDLRAFPETQPTDMQIMLTNAFPWIERTVPYAARLSVGTVLDVTLTSRGRPAHWTPVIGRITHTITPHEWAVDLGLISSRVVVAPPGGGTTGGYDATTSRYDITKYATPTVPVPPKPTGPTAPTEPPPPQPTAPSGPTVPPPVGAIVINGGSAAQLQTVLNQAAATGRPVTCKGTFDIGSNVRIPSNVHVTATGAMFLLSGSGRFRNATNGSHGGYTHAGGWTWDGGEFNGGSAAGKGDGIWTISHSPGFTIKNTTMYAYADTNNVGHAIEINSSGGPPTSAYTVVIQNNKFRGVRGQRANSNDEAVHFDYAWDGSGADAPFDMTICNNVRIVGNNFHRVNESGAWQFALCAIGGHDREAGVRPPKVHSHFLIESNVIHGSVGSTSSGPNKGAIHAYCLRNSVIRNNTLYGGVVKRYLTAERTSDVPYVTATGNQSNNPVLSNPNTIVVEG